MSMHDTASPPIEGFTAFICFAAPHEVIRQGRWDLTLVRLTPDVIYDQMVAAGCAQRLVFGYLGNPGVGFAGATGLPFFPLRSYAGSDPPLGPPRHPHGRGHRHDRGAALVTARSP
jgi:glutaconate CoA-transferase subunit A